nr:hypothetical protein [Tanacetum cinerariifolium]
MEIMLLRPQHFVIGETKEILGTQSSNTTVDQRLEKNDDPHKALKDKEIVDSGCSRHMTGNKAHLADYQEFKGDSVAFGGSNDKITSKGKIKAGRLDFEDVYYVEELKHYNLFFVSQMCDKKNKKGKQHKASCKTKTVSSLNQPLQILHMDLFGPTSDETTPILKDFIRQAKNQFNHKVKTIRSDNGTEFKNHELIEFCGSKGIKREYSTARTPQQNRVAERKNMTLIEAARTMLADSFLHTTFWAEAVNTACYVLNRVLVTKPQNKTPYELLTGPQEANNSAGTQANDDQGTNSEEIDLHDEHFILPIWSAYSTTIKSSKDKIQKTTDCKICEKPVSQVEQIFQEELEKLKSQEKEANDATRKEATHENQDANTNNTNLLNVVSAPVSVVGPSRALNDVEPSYPDDPSMHHLEDIFASPCEEIFTNSSYDDEGVVIDFNNLETTVNVNPTPTTRIHTIHPKTQILRDPMSAIHTRSKVKKNFEAHALISQALEDESWVDATQEELLQFQIQKEEGIDYDAVFAHVARIEAIRIFLAFSSYMGFIVYQMDVKSAFLYGTIDEEVYVIQPPGFVDPKFPNKVYKVVKALYGLHQAPRAWYATLSTFLEKKKSGYRKGAIDKNLFIKQDKKDIMLVQVYVDDIIFGSTKKSWCDEFEELIKNSVKTARTPIETQKPLVKDEEAADVDVHLYRFQVTPKTSHLQAVKRIFRYLKGQPKLGLWYPKVLSFNLEAYSDSDYVGANLDRKSTTRGCQFLGRRLILWQCKKQTIVTTSTT